MHDVDNSTAKAAKRLRGYLIRLTREYTDGGMDSRAEESKGMQQKENGFSNPLTHGLESLCSHNERIQRFGCLAYLYRVAGFSCCALFSSIVNSSQLERFDL
jgi:hypothetical protein